MDKELTVPKCSLIVRPKISQMLQKCQPKKYAQAQKIEIFERKHSLGVRSPWAKVKLRNARSSTYTFCKSRSADNWVKIALNWSTLGLVYIWCVSVPPKSFPYSGYGHLEMSGLTGLLAGQVHCLILWCQFRIWNWNVKCSSVASMVFRSGGFPFVGFHCTG